MTVFKGIRYLFVGIPTRSFDILYNMHSFATFLRSARDLQPNDWSILVTLDGIPREVEMGFPKKLRWYLIEQVCRGSNV